jgi:uncharacterized phage-associated protein
MNNYFTKSEFINTLKDILKTVVEKLHDYSANQTHQGAHTRFLACKANFSG